jgi:hypothetical protein
MPASPLDRQQLKFGGSKSQALRLAQQRRQVGGGAKFGGERGRFRHGQKMEASNGEVKRLRPWSGVSP